MITVVPIQEALNFLSTNKDGTIVLLGFDGYKIESDGTIYQPLSCVIDFSEEPLGKNSFQLAEELIQKWISSDSKVVTHVEFVWQYCSEKFSCKNGSDKKGGE